MARTRRYTGEILEILNRFQVKSIFFRVGENVARLDGEDRVEIASASAPSPEAEADHQRRAWLSCRSTTESWERCRTSTRVALDLGHLVAHHSYTHAFLPKLDADALAGELDKTTRVLQQSVDVRPAIFRPPYGALSDTVRALVAERGMLIMLWNIDSR
ncbi:MAG: polysaccharide deacetylase family protein, partial [bacterium]|nr:polysaccharide deacetylase family protein [bacterium]